MSPPPPRRVAAPQVRAQTDQLAQLAPSLADQRDHRNVCRDIARQMPHQGGLPDTRACENPQSLAPDKRQQGIEHPQPRLEPRTQPPALGGLGRGCAQRAFQRAAMQADARQAAGRKGRSRDPANCRPAQFPRHPAVPPGRPAPRPRARHRPSRPPPICPNPTISPDHRAPSGSPAATRSPIRQSGPPPASRIVPRPTSAIRPKRRIRGSAPICAASVANRSVGIEFSFCSAKPFLNELALRLG